MAMTAPLDCLELPCWQALVDETISPEQREHYERHLESCTACQDRLHHALGEGGMLLKWLREVGDPSPDPPLDQFLERLRNLESPFHAATDEPADLYFLCPTDQPGLLGTLGNYEVQEVIGQGGMGVVLKAYEPALCRQVAIKVLSPPLAGSATARRRFRREAQAAAAVCHDHVVAVHGVHETDGLPYLVMQYVAGESLQARLDRTGPLEVVEIVRIGMQTAAGLAAAHAQGLIHRDIKPANLLLEGLFTAEDAENAARRPEEEQGVPSSSALSALSAVKPLRVKITDFGLARMVDDVGLTRDGVVAGTPEYMAPEQTRGEAVDHRADLFSLGSVLYASATGFAPFRGSTALAVLRHVCEQEPAPVRSCNPDVPAWLEGVIMRLMAKAPTARFQSAAEVADLLEAYLAHLHQPATVAAPELPVAAGNEQGPTEPGSLPRVVRRFSSRPWFAVLVCLAALGLAVGQWFAGAGGEAQPNTEYREQYSISLRGTPEDNAGFEFFGPNVEECVRYEPAGLRLTFPRGFPGRRPGTGLTIPVAAKGDFEITVGFEILQEPQPAAAPTQQTLFSLDAVLDAPGSTLATIARKVDAPSGTQFLAWMTVWDEEAQQDRPRGKAFPTTAKSGRLRMVRTGSTLAYYAAAPESDFVLLERFPFAAEDLKFVRLLGSTGGPQAELDVRATDLTIRAGLMPDLPEKSRGKGWLAAGTILSLLIFLLAALALCAWLGGRQRRRAGQQPVGASVQGAPPNAAAQVISFVCPHCGANVKARADQVGRKGKCPQCGKAVLVPGDRVTTRPEESLPPSSPAGKQTRTPLLRRWRLAIPPALLLLLLLAGGFWWLHRPQTTDQAAPSEVVNGAAQGGPAVHPQTPGQAAPSEGRSFLDVRLGHEPQNDIEESGFSFQERDQLNESFRWTDGRARLVIPLRPGEAPRALEVKLSAFRQEQAEDASLQIRVNNQELFQGKIPLRKWEKTFDLTGINLRSQVVVEITSDTFTALGTRQPNGQPNNDTRSLGVQVRGVTLLTEVPQTPKVVAGGDGDNPLVTVWRGHPAAVSCGAVTPDGKTLVSGSWDGTVKVWDVAANRERQTFPALVPNVSALAISPTGETFATAAVPTVCVWETGTGKLLVKLPGPAGQVANVALAYSPDGKILAAAGGEPKKAGELKLWDWRAGKESARVEPFNLRQWSVSFSPDGKHVAVSGGDGMVTVVEVDSGRGRAFFAHPSWSRGVSFSPDGKRLAVSSGNQGRLYDWEAGKQLCDFQAPDAKLILGTAFAPDGKALLTHCGDGTALLWDVTASPVQVVRTLRSGAKRNSFVLFLPDGRSVATGCDDGTIRLMKVENAR
jgi:serine/threonine protein kinase/WD40 repeat protein